MLNNLIQITTSGIAMGMVYALISIGLILLIRAVGVMNFAQGNLLALGAFIMYFFQVQRGLPIGATIIGGVILFALVGVIFMFSVYFPVRNSSWNFAIIICTIGASTVINELIMHIWGSRVIPVEPIIPGTSKIFGAVIANQILLIIGVGALIMLFCWILFEKMYFGKVMLAAAQNPYSATLLGISTVLTTAVTYAIVMNILGFSGYMVAPVLILDTSLSNLQMKAFAGVVIGGFGSLKGAVIGSILIGLIEAYSIFVTTTFKDVIVFGVLLLILMFKPDGLFEYKKIQEKA